MIKKFVDFLLEYKKEDVELVKSMSDHFTLAIEYEICSTEDPEDEPPVEDIETVLEKVREQTLLDLSRGKIGESKVLSISIINKNKDKLETLWCWNNNLTSLKLEGLDKLEYLYCQNNNLPYKDLDSYWKWFAKEYPERWEARKFNF